eukprot:TRINITY_DN3240_c0_g1_i4.p2 TRINITY_DN3240_c0_g1~~TRINITY_DN3240_c0_g1_i4.p2  ORF type:complete len:111 (-),score=16.24 TRINITY_DN3240_c0_g1_i4:50-382(-)
MTTISFALQVLVCVSLIGSSLELTYPKNKYVLVNNTLELYWEIVDQNITFALKLNSTKGWAGVGIGSSMTGADIITMELINGQIIINDRYSSGRGPVSYTHLTLPTIYSV